MCPCLTINLTWIFVGGHMPMHIFSFVSVIKGRLASPPSYISSFGGASQRVRSSSFSKLRKQLLSVSCIFKSFSLLFSTNDHEVLSFNLLSISWGITLSRDLYPVHGEVRHEDGALVKEALSLPWIGSLPICLSL